MHSGPRCHRLNSESAFTWQRVGLPGIMDGKALLHSLRPFGRNRPAEGLSVCCQLNTGEPDIVQKLVSV